MIIMIMIIQMMVLGPALPASRVQISWGLALLTAIKPRYCQGVSSNTIFFNNVSESLIIMKKLPEQLKM